MNYITHGLGLFSFHNFLKKQMAYFPMKQKLCAMKIIKKTAKCSIGNHLIKKWHVAKY